MKRQRVMMFLIFFAVLFLPVFAFANGPMPAFNSITVYVENAPEESYGADLLLPEEFFAGRYTECNDAAIIDMGLEPSCGLVSFDSEGFISYSSHYTGAECNGVLQKDAYGGDSLSALLSYDEYSFDYMVNDIRTVKLAVFDDAGNIIGVSDTIMLINSPAESFYGTIRYDMAAGKADVDSSVSFSAIISGVLGIIFAVGITICIELLAGLIFKVKPLRYVAKVTFFTNLTFNVLIFIFYFVNFSFFPYVAFVVMGEAATVVVEFFVYKRIYTDISAKRLLLFSVIANAVSAGTVILLNHFAEDILVFLMESYFSLIWA